MQNSASAAVFIAVLMVLAGVTTGLQPATNGMLTRTLNSPINAAFAGFLIGTVILGALVLVLRPAPDWRATAALPWYAWLGGAYGAFYIAMSAFAAPRIGTGPTIALLIAGQAAAALAVDQFGLFGVPRHPIDLTRAAGMVAVVGGVLLVRRG